MFSSQSHGQTHNTVFIFKLGTDPRTCWNHLNLGLVLLANAGSGQDGLASCGFSNFWFQTSPHLINYKNSGVDGVFKPCTCRSRMLFCLSNVFILGFPYFLTSVSGTGTQVAGYVVTHLATSSCENKDMKCLSHPSSTGKEPTRCSVSICWASKWGISKQINANF